MTTFTIITIIAAVVLIALALVCTFYISQKLKANNMQADVQKIEPLIRQEFMMARTEATTNAKHTKEEITGSLAQMHQALRESAKQNREEQANGINQFQENIVNLVNRIEDVGKDNFKAFYDKQDALRNETALQLDKIKNIVDDNLKRLSEENARKLDEMRNTVDEKLSATITDRFNGSFKLISDRLEQVHKGLGEMQTIATNVGDLKRVMSNVKMRGVLGEYQLQNILEDLLTAEQFGRDVKPIPHKGSTVEFAVKMPNGNSVHDTLWLPIDAKFPKEDYENLVEAYETAEADNIKALVKKFKESVIKCAKDINAKYIEPPYTTDYAIMFLPFESLFAEVLRVPGLVEEIQRTYKVSITGPTTLSALLNSLQMGFRTLAIQKKSSDVWCLLNTVQKEFGNFGTILEKVNQQLNTVSKTMKLASSKTNTINKQLQKVQLLDAPQSELLASADDEGEYLLGDDLIVYTENSD
jgi:DNA recombination protein RmuC